MAKKDKMARTPKAALKKVARRVSQRKQPVKPGRQAGEPRVRQVTPHRHFRLSPKVVKKSTKPLPGVKKLFKSPIGLMANNKLLFGGLISLFALLQFVFIQGFGATFTLLQTKEEIQEITGDDSQTLETTYALFSYLLTSSNSQVTEVAGAYQTFFTFIFLLATIWLTRQLLAGEKPRIRDGFYRGMYPLIPFLLVGLVFALQLIPLLLGSFIFSTVIANGLAVTVLEKVLWGMIFFGLALLTFYMIISSLFALFVVSLADVTPMQALRSARGLVLHRRVGIFARIIVVPIVGLILLGIVLLPLIAFLPIVVEPLLLLLSSFGLIFITVYLYNLYRELL